MNDGIRKAPQIDDPNTLKRIILILLDSINNTSLVSPEMLEFSYLELESKNPDDLIIERNMYRATIQILSNRKL